MNLLNGLCAFPLTPSNAHGVVDTDALGRLVERVRDAKADSVCVLGTTGTYAYLTRPERLRAIKTAVAQADGMPVLAGIGALRTDEVLALGRDAQDAGVSAALLAPMSYTPLSDDEVYRLYETAAGVLKIPICIYNNPGTTHFTFSTALVHRLSRLPGIIGIKNPAPVPSEASTTIQALRSEVPAGFSLGVSADWHAAEALIAGADVWYSVLAGLFPDQCVRLVRAAQGGKPDLARSLDAQLEPLWALFREFSSLRVMYAAANELKLIDAAPPLPLLPLASRDQARVGDILAALALT